MKFLNVFRKISNMTEAKDAAMAGAGSAGFVVVATIFVILIGKLSSTALVDAAIFSVVCWRIFKMSRAWAVAGLIIFILEKVVQISEGTIPTASGAIIVGLFVLAGFVWGVRGTFAFHKIKVAETTQIVEVPSPASVPAAGKPMVSSNEPPLFAPGMSCAQLMEMREELLACIKDQKHVCKIAVPVTDDIINLTLNEPGTPYYITKQASAVARVELEFSKRYAERVLEDQQQIKRRS